MKTIFMGTPEFGAIILDKLSDTPYRPILVVTAPDKPKGRERLFTPSPVKVATQKYQITLEQPKKVKDLVYRIAKIAPDLVVVAAYGKILPREILEIPKYGCLNVHPSLLPRWRGPSPVQQTILNGDKETGVTIILMDEKMDHGPIIKDSRYKIEDLRLTYEDLSKKLANLGAKLLIDTIPEWISDKITPEPQDESKATYTKIIKKEDGKIDWQESAQQIERKIRAFYFWPGTFCFWDKKQLKILESEVLKQTKVGPFGVVGKTFLAPDDKIAVQTGKDFLIITRLQPEGKKPMASEDFLRGHQDFIGTILK